MNEPKIVLSGQGHTERVTQAVSHRMAQGVEQTLISLLLRVENFSVTKSLVFLLLSEASLTRP